MKCIRLLIFLLTCAIAVSCNENTPPAQLSLSAQQIYIPQSGGFVDFNVFTNTSWQVEPGSSIFRLSPLSGTGSTPVRIEVEANTDFSSRSETFTILAAQLSVPLTLTQKGIVAQCNVSPTSALASYSGDHFLFNVTANCPWQISGQPSWCTVSPTQGNGDATLEVTVLPNRNADNETAPRSATVTIGNSALDIARQITIEQDGYIINPRMLDSLVLVRFYNQTSGKDWKKNTWNLTLPMNEWAGIRLDSTGRVDSLALSSGTLPNPGPIPDCLGELTSLVCLSLSNNGFTGTIPESLGQLTLLRRLSFSTNADIKQPFPLWICRLTALERLSLSNMSGIYGPLPAEIGDLVNLVDFNLVGCSGLSGSIPPEIGKLIHITNMQLNGVPFIGTIPKEMGNMQSLKTLGLYNTKLSLPIPDELFENLKNIQSMLFHKNSNFSGPLPAALGRLRTTASSLSIRFEECNFTGTIPESWSNIPLVSTQLRVWGNRLSGEIPAIIKQHSCWNSDIWDPGRYICPQQEGFGFTNCE